MKSREKYGLMPTILGVAALTLWTLFVITHAPKGEPLPTCATTDSCEYFMETIR